MPAASYVKYTAAIEPMLEGMNAGSDSWKVALAATVNVADTTFVPGTTDTIATQKFGAASSVHTVEFF